MEPISQLNMTGSTMPAASDRMMFPMPACAGAADSCSRSSRLVVSGPRNEASAAGVVPDNHPIAV